MEEGKIVRKNERDNASTVRGDFEYQDDDDYTLFIL